MEKKKLLPGTGRILISEPGLFDGYFSKSIVLLIEHLEAGTLGLIINKPLNKKLNDLLLDSPETDVAVYIGGPVEKSNLFILHTLGDKLLSNSLHISDGIYWGGNFEEIYGLIKEKKVNNTNLRFYLGYSGWQAGQLENELKDNSWIVDNVSSGMVFNNSPDKLWHDYMIKLGKDYAIWSNSPNNPILN
ncbi:MAG: YqgE/AlgH family protein [Bacteroidales bacterium]|nr:YqgE/AlgH family protein [Bacteroidales bacterium]